jgi:predicted nucleic acid-binding protein
VVVLDASAVIDFLIDRPGGEAMARILSSNELHAPYLIDIEVAHSLRHAVLGGRLTPGRAAGAIEDFRALPIERHPHEHLLLRLLALRDHATAYDAIYVALAELLGVPLITRDRGLSRSSGHTATIQYVD